MIKNINQSLKNHLEPIINENLPKKIIPGKDYISVTGKVIDKNDILAGVDATLDAYDAEADIVEWIFEMGDLDFLTKEQTLEFIKHRFNESLNAIGVDSVFNVDEKVLETTEWFDDEILTTKHTDFFNKRSINYSKKQKSITEDDLF